MLPESSLSPCPVQFSRGIFCHGRLLIANLTSPDFSTPMGAAGFVAADSTHERARTTPIMRG